MTVYLDQLDMIRGLQLRWKSKGFIIKLLQSEKYGLSLYLANKRYSDAMNFFYSDQQIKKEAWKNIYADKLDNLARATILSATQVKDYKIAGDLLKEAASIRGVNDPEADVLPPELFTKVARLYTTDVSKLGLPKANRNQLAKLIDGLDANEVDKIRMKQDAMILDPKIFPNETEDSRKSD